MARRCVVLLHGAGIGPWAWDRVRSLLGDHSVALEVPGRKPGATPEGCAEHLFAQMNALDADEFVIVAHSLSGVLVPALAARLGSRLVHVVYVACVIPRDGQSFLAAVGFPMGLLMRVLFRMKPSGLRPSDSMIRSGLCNDLDDADTADVIERYEAEFRGLYATPVPGPASVASTYVRLERDGSVAPSTQSKMIARLGSPDVVEIDAGHLVMLSQPEELARAVRGVASA